MNKNRYRNRYKRRYGYGYGLALFLLAAALLGGCGAQNAAQYATTQAATMAAAATTQATAMNVARKMEYDGEAGGGGVGEEYAPGDNYNDEAEITAYADGETKVERKEIKNVSCNMVVKDVQAAYAKVNAIVEQLGGYEFNKTESNVYGTDYKHYSITIKLPPDTIQAFEDGIRAIEGDKALNYFNIWSDDITSMYYDTAARLDSMRASMEQYRIMIARAFSVKDMLEIQREMTSLQASIDSLQGQINMWNSLVSYATVDLRIEQEPDPIAQVRNEDWRFNTPNEIFNAMGNGFISTANTVYQVVINILVFIISSSPVLVPLGIVVLLVLRSRKKKRARMLLLGLPEAQINENARAKKLKWPKRTFKPTIPITTPDENIELTPEPDPEAGPELDPQPAPEDTTDSN